jgi:hypothetical protein
MNFTFTWIMDKLGYMPKIDMQVGQIADIAFPAPDKRKPTLKKATTRVKKNRDLPSRATVAKTARTKKAK